MNDSDSLLGATCTLNSTWKNLLHLRVFKLKLLELFVTVTICILTQVFPVRNVMVCFVASPIAILCIMVIIMYLTGQPHAQLDFYYIFVGVGCCILAFAAFFIPGLNEPLFRAFPYKMFIIDLLLCFIYDVWATRHHYGCVV